MKEEDDSPSIRATIDGIALSSTAGQWCYGSGGSTIENAYFHFPVDLALSATGDAGMASSRAKYLNAGSLE